MLSRSCGRGVRLDILTFAQGAGDGGNSARQGGVASNPHQQGGVLQGPVPPLHVPCRRTWPELPNFVAIRQKNIALFDKKGKLLQAIPLGAYFLRIENSM
ncbi:MAG: hypothetical protein C0613_05900 [Desulfobulbaceae bacterium]|nr:MAG: hypothetical protein C0613_05900 [Desulfobulbaceae bacterium]